MSIPTRESLLERLKNLEDQASWREFFLAYWRLIYAVAIKARLSDAEAQDVVQETVIEVARRMPTFTYRPGRDSFKGWLLQLTRWKIIGQIRKRSGANLPFDPLLGESDPGTMLEEMGGHAGEQLNALWDEEWRKHTLKLALKRIRRQVSAQHYEIFVRYGIKEEPAQEVARACGVTVGQIYLVKHRIADLVRGEIKQLETQFV